MSMNHACLRAKGGVERWPSWWAAATAREVGAVSVSFGRVRVVPLPRAGISSDRSKQNVCVNVHHLETPRTSTSK